MRIGVGHLPVRIWPHELAPDPTFFIFSYVFILIEGANVRKLISIIGFTACCLLSGLAGANPDDRVGVPEALTACQALKGYCSGEITKCGQVASQGHYFSTEAVQVCRAMIGHYSCGMTSCMQAIRNKEYLPGEASICANLVGVRTNGVPECMSELGRTVVRYDSNCPSNQVIIEKIESALNIIYSSRRPVQAAQPLEELRAQLSFCDRR